MQCADTEYFLQLHEISLYIPVLSLSTQCYEQLLSTIAKHPATYYIKQTQVMNYPIP